MIKFILITIFLLNSTFADEFHVDKDKKNMVKFISDAPIEDFEGVTSNIDGYLIGNPSNIKEDSELYFEVQLNTLETGIGLRDRHMRENYLHTDKYPLTHFTGKIIEAKKTPEGWDVKVSGEMFVHGVKKKQTIKGEMIKTSKGYRVKSSFIVALTDHKIEVPSLMFQKIDENMQLELDFYLMKVD
jgi:polyisoprenoid-binding protein YceI